MSHNDGLNDKCFTERVLIIIASQRWAETCHTKLASPSTTTYSIIGLNDECRTEMVSMMNVSQ